MAPQVAAAGARRCRARPQPRQAGDLRPTDVVGAFFIAGLAFLLAAAVAGTSQWLDPWPWGRWLALHLAFVGGISQLVLGASQFFAGAFLATDPPPRALVRVQLASWNAGSVLLAIAIPAGLDAWTWVAVGLLLLGLIAWTAAMAAMRRRSISSSPWATRWYVSGACFLGVGIVAGSLLAQGTPWAHGDLLAAHMSLNLAGWFGGAIVGTLHTFYPSLTRTQLRFPRLQPPAFAAWTAAVGALAGGYAWSLEPLALAGWVGLCLGSLLLLANLLACLLGAPRPLSLPARIVGVAQPFLLLALLLATVVAFGDGTSHAVAGPSRNAFGTLLVAGWIGLTVLGSLLHLLAVVARVRGGFSVQMPAARPGRDAALAALAGAAIALLSLAQLADLDGLGQAGRLMLLAAYALLAARISYWAGRVIVGARPSV